LWLTTARLRPVGFDRRVCETEGDNVAQYQIVFRNKDGGQRAMFIDDTTADRLSHLRQPLELGGRISIDGSTWTVVEESMHHGAHRFICKPVTHWSPAAPPAGAHPGPIRLRVPARRVPGPGATTRGLM
jgi:hypothetical protein